MAYIDDNSELTAGKGKDPLKELDDELEELLAQLNQADDSDPAPPEEPSAQDSDPAKDALPVEPEAEMPPPVITQTRPSPAPRPPKKRSKAPIIIVAVVLAGLLVAGGWYLIDRLVAGGWYLIDRLLATKVSVGSEKKQVATETFTDSELGEITVKKVEGADLNTYDTNNLVKNENGFYQYVVDGKVTSEVGVDLAEYQGDIDFAAVKKCGVDFVILRIGGRYYSQEGKLYEDGMFDTYYEQAKAAGLKVGAYFFSQAANTDEAAEEAGYVVTKLNGRPLDYPVAFDWETIEDDEARTDNVSGKTITEMAEKFCDTITAKGYQAIVYSSTSLMLQSYDFETMKDYAFWLADYREFPNMYYDFAIWQYAKDGTVDGISGAVDLNICFKPY